MTAAAHAATETSVIVSQVYGGGGNSGATYKNDFIELFNPTASPITLSNWSVQYGSATSTTSLAVFALPSSVTIQPGQFYLIQAAAGAGGTVSLTPDAIVTVNMSGTAGKLALVSSTTAVAGCPTSDPTLADFVGFGGTTTAVNCSLGSPAPLLSNTTAAIRTNLCSPTSNNATDFTAAAPNPRNSSTPPVPCGGVVGSAPPFASGLATPAAVFQNASTLLTANVIPGTLPTSTGLRVSANLSAIGGSTAQPLYDDGTHGDLTAGDNVFSFSISPNSVGTFNLPISVADAQLRSATASIALTVSTPPPFVPIRMIQATKPSAYATKSVVTSGIVIGVKSSGFYLESADADTTPTTPEGILVYTGSAVLPSYITVGANIQVSGVVNTYPTTGLTPGTEIDAPQTFTLINTGNPLPTPVKITAAMDSPAGGIYQFAKYEGMRVAIDSLTTTSGTDAALTETTETNTSNGRFYGIVTGVPRPFREPGISVTDTAYTLPIRPGVPLWDSNPELLYFDSLSFGGPAIDLTSNATLTGVSGVMDFSSGSPEIYIDQATRPSVSGLMTATAVPARAATEFNVGTFNMERFYNDVADADNPSSTAVVVTTAAYQRRLSKGSLAIRNVLLAPDILGLEEIENINVVTDLANKISADAIAAGQPDPKYLPFCFLATDGTAINTAVLVKSTTVDVIKAEQFGLTNTFTNASGAQATLNDRTPLVVHAGIKRASGPDYLVTFIVVHQRSLISVDDPTSTGATVRLKREAQAEYLARLIQGYQAGGEHVITVGDFNSFEFSDGFVDTMGVTLGTPVPASQVITPPAAGLASPPLVDLVTLLPPQQRQSYVETGSAQVLDHVVVTQDLLPTQTRFVYAHIDADFPLVDQNDATTPLRVSDHDPAVAYFMVPPAPLPLVTLSISTLAFGSQLVGTSATQTVSITNSGNAALAFTSITTTGAGFSQTNSCGSSLAVSTSCTVNVAFSPAAVGSATGSLPIATNAASSPDMVALTGTGTAPLVTLSAATLTFPGQLVATPATQSIKLTNAGTAPLTVSSIAASGAGFAQSNTCGTSVAVSSSCTITVTFNPATASSLTGALSIVTNASSSPNTVALNGTGIAPIATLSASSIAFGTQLITVPSTMSVALTNTGTAPLTISLISATGLGFSQTNTCPASLAIAAVCSITATFSPGTTGPLTGAISITSSASSTPATIALTGTGGDFSLTASTPTATVTDGSSATLQFTANAISGYTGTVSLACSNLYVGETCTITPSSLALSGTSQPFSVVITTTGTYLSGLNAPQRPRSLPPQFRGFGGVAAAALFGLISRRRLRSSRKVLSAGLGLMLLLVVAGCQTNYNQLNPNGTARGPQVLTITAVSNGVSRSTTVTLTIQ